MGILSKITGGPSKKLLLTGLPGRSISSLFRRFVTNVVIMSMVALSLQLLAMTDAHAAAAFSDLTLENGWSALTGTATPSASLANGVVTLNGAIRTAGTDGVAFTLPAADSPPTAVYVSVDFAGGDSGRLYIQPSGVVTVEADGGDFSDAAAFVSLTGAWFSVKTSGYTPLTLVNGWANAPFSTSNAEVQVASGIVRFKGAVAGGTAATIATVPAAFRPPANVFLPVNLCDAVSGQLEITPDGTVTVQPESGSFSDASCFTSLDGVSYSTTTSGFTPLTPASGWTNAPSGTSPAAAQEINGIVHLEGAFETSGANRVPTTLPPALSPSVETYVKVDLCNGVSGQLGITTSGAVVMNVEGMDFPPVNCVVSLDGVTFPGVAFTKLKLQNGWQAAPGSPTPGAALLSSQHGEAVALQGAITTAGTNAVAFTLSKRFRPSWNVYVPVDMCDATNGRLLIASDGSVTVQAESGAFANAQCLTSLDGVTFVLKTKNGFGAAILLENGWTADSASLGTFQPSQDLINNILYLQGAISGGTSPVIGTVAFHPPANLYIPVDECGGAIGRIQIDPSGTVSVEGNLSDAQCFTSFEGVSWGTADTPTTLTLENGWTGGPFGTADPAVDNLNGIVRFVGAMSTTGTNPVAFVLPAGLAPSQTVHVKVDLCNATNGELVITPDGTATVNAENGTFSNATCFTSLDGVSFAR
jgi:hypothetical protein